jgi:hypothetical protein
VCFMSSTINFHVLHCEAACALWNGIFSRVGLSWIMPSRVVDLFACWRGIFGGTQSAVVWKIVPSYRSFKDRERTVVELKYFFFNTLYFCTIAFVFPNLLSFHDYSFFFFFLLLRCFSCILLVYLG